MCMFNVSHNMQTYVFNSFTSKRVSHTERYLIPCTHLGCYISIVNLFFGLRFYVWENIFCLRYKDQSQRHIIININSYSCEVVRYCFPVLTQIGAFRPILVEKHIYSILRALFQWESGHAIPLGRWMDGHEKASNLFSTVL